MIKKLLLMLAAAMPLWALHAQVEIKLEFQKRVFLQYEPVWAKVTMTNNSGKTLVFGKSDEFKGELKFEIMDREKRMIPLIDPQAKLADGLIIMPGQSQELFVPLNRYYNLTPVSRYDVHCYISHSQLSIDYESNHDYIEVSSGVTEWTRTVGLPAFILKEDSPGQETTRTYKLVTLISGIHKELFAIVEDAKFVYRVRPICNLFAQEKFSAEVDHLGRLHVFAADGQDTYKYAVMTLDGDIDLELQYRSGETVPVLVRDAKTGKVSVNGGVMVEPGKN